MLPSNAAATGPATTIWRKSTYSTKADNCVEISTELPGWVGVRDSKLGPSSPILAFTYDEWRALIDGVRAGELGLDR